MRAILISSVAFAVMATAAMGQSQTVTGVGQAPVTRDVEGVRAQAEQAAREDLVRAMARRAIGAERLGELSPDLVRRLADQIRDEMIVGRSSERIGASFQVKLDARIDPAWFQARLDDEGVQSSGDRASSEQQPIFVMIEENTGPARDYQQPSEIVEEYDRDSGASFSDKSVAAYSEKARQAQSFKGDSASRTRAAGAVGYSDGYGSAAGAAARSSASSTSIRDSSASSYSAAAVDKTDVQADVHDIERYRYRVSYQTSATTGPARTARAALGSELIRYGVRMAADELELASYFKGPSPTYSTLTASPAFKPFLDNLSRRGVAPFFMGGTVTLRDAGRDGATGLATCTGSLAATAYATGNSAVVAEGAANATASGLTYEDCSAKLSEALAAQAAAKLGPQVQDYWRRQLRSQTQTVAAATGVADYTLTVRAANLTMDMQADLLDALGATPGVERQAFLGQTQNQISFQVRYGGSTPLQMALYQRLRSRPGFEKMQPTTQGQTVILCLSGC